MRFRSDGNKEYNNYLTDLKYYTGDKSQHDDSPDATAMLATICQTVFRHEFY